MYILLKTIPLVSASLCVLEGRSTFSIEDILALLKTLKFSLRHIGKRSAAKNLGG